MIEPPGADEDTDDRVGFRVTGRVQGVGFRWSSARRARELGLRGWVRNCADGSVEVGVAGPRAVVERFVEWLGHGPRGAVVERVEARTPTLPIPDEGFEIV